LFFILATFYSTPPLRFKAKPFLDFSSNILYAIPGIIGYVLLSNSFPSWPVLLALFCWTSAMHLFSAIPDIEADAKAKLTTTAVLLGEQPSLLLCFVFWFLTALIPIIYGYALPLTLLLWIYPGLIIIAWGRKLNLAKVYWWFPYITGTLGFISYWYFFILKLL
jgi:4-hydroxybenzoate polyprenyltransferase